MRVARRPTRGIEIKEDRPALLKVIQADGSELKLFDSGAVNGEVKSATNFILQSVQEARMEKHQIVETFGQSYVFFFGESPRFLDVTVTLINSHDFNWRAEWWANYENFFRGTKLVEMGARLYMFYDDNIVEGYMLNAVGQEMSDQPYLVTLQFRLFLTNYRNITEIGAREFPIRNNFVQVDQEVIDPNKDGRIVSSNTKRSLISDNEDEYIGAPAEDLFKLNTTPDPTQLNQEEVDDLHLSSIGVVNGQGGNANSPQALRSMGLMPVYPEAGAPTFTPQPTETFGPGITDAVVEPFSNLSEGNEGSLGAVFGGGIEASITDRSFVDGGGDRSWGYRSDHSNQPGFGGPGYGDLGGNGHGAGGGADGERGHRDPNLFSFEGVADNEGAFSRFNSPEGSSTVFNINERSKRNSRTGRIGRTRPNAAQSGGTGGATTQTTGAPSPHTLTSVPGELQPDENCLVTGFVQVGSDVEPINLICP